MKYKKIDGRRLSEAQIQQIYKDDVPVNINMGRSQITFTPNKGLFPAILSKIEDMEQFISVEGKWLKV